MSLTKKKKKKSKGRRANWYLSESEEYFSSLKKEKIGSATEMF